MEYRRDQRKCGIKVIHSADDAIQQDLTQDLLHQALIYRQVEQQAWRSWKDLTPRQQEIAALICLGYTSPQIAARLSVSPETVKTHVRHLLEKFHLRTRQELRQALEDWDFSDWK